LSYGSRAPRGQHGDALLGLDALDPVAHPPHAVRAFERVVRQRDVGHRLAAAEHQVRERARDEGRIRLDQRDVDALRGQQAQYFAAVAPP
jgi:hypothetical protein